MSLPQSSCLSLLNTGISNVSYHAWLSCPCSFNQGDSQDHSSSPWVFSCVHVCLCVQVSPFPKDTEPTASDKVQLQGPYNNWISSAKTLLPNKALSEAWASQLCILQREDNSNCHLTSFLFHRGTIRRYACQGPQGSVRHSRVQSPHNPGLGYIQVPFTLNAEVGLCS